MSTNLEDVSSRDRITQNFRDLVNDAEALLKSTAAYTGEGYEAARARVTNRIETAKGAIMDLEGRALDRYKEASASTETYVRANPWQAVGIAVAVGALVGFLANRR